MLKDQNIYNIQDIEFKVIYSKRTTLGISVLPDSSVVVRVPYFTSHKTISRIVSQKASWILKHRNNYRMKEQGNNNTLYIHGERHLFRGRELILKVEESGKSYIMFTDDSIDIGLANTEDTMAVKELIYKGYKNEAMIVFPEIFNNILNKYEAQGFKPTGLVIRTMRRRWGSCSGKGIITLSTELIKLPDIFIEYVIMHELCHLKYHNHGDRYYNLLSGLFPDYKKMRKELRKYITH